MFIPDYWPSGVWSDTGNPCDEQQYVFWAQGLCPYSKPFHASVSLSGTIPWRIE